MTTSARPVVLVTGGNSGIGFECARVLARRGWHVVIASRDRQRSAAAAERMTRESGDGLVTAMQLDLGALASVRAFAAALAATHPPLRAFVCNAGLQGSGALRRSSDGFELTFAANHLGHFLLTHLLLERLRAHGPARIVVVASGVHDPRLRTGMPKAAVGDMDTLAATGGPDRNGFNPRLAYVNSKLCNLWFTYELARRIAGAGWQVTVNGFDPGLVPGSGLARDYPAPLRMIWDRVLPLVARALSPVVAGINPASKAGAALAQLVLDPGLESVSGQYFPSHTRWHPAPSSDASYDVERARALWEASVRMCGLQPHESALGGA